MSPVARGAQGSCGGGDLATGIGGWVSADGLCHKAFQKSESADDQISVIRRSAALLIAVASLQAQCLQTVEGEQRPRSARRDRATAGPSSLSDLAER
jgi:hypothetical protein